MLLSRYWVVASSSVAPRMGFYRYVVSFDELGLTAAALVLEQKDQSATALVLADAGFASQSGKVKQLLDSGHRVICMDPLLIGQAAPPDSIGANAMLIGTVGERPLGIQVAQLLAAIEAQEGAVTAFDASVRRYTVTFDEDTTAEALYDDLQATGYEVLFDDRTDSAGVKFNDADLLGLPVRLVVSPRNLRDEMVELKERGAAEARLIPRDQIVEAVGQVLNSSTNAP